jgi:hypothetical protein
LQAQVNVLCYGTATGALQVLSPNTNAGYSYSWENMNNLGISISDTTQAINLMAGTYVLYADYADSNNLNYAGCRTTDTVTITEITIIHSNYIIEDVSCNGGSDGSITTSTFGGTSPYQYDWTPPQSSNNTIGNLTAGIYTLSITDANGCEVIETYTVIEPAELIVTVNQNQTYILNATSTGGVAPYSYAWMEQLQGQMGVGNIYTVIDYGIYYAVVTDANGCASQSNSLEYEEVTGLENELTNLNLSIYPNPFKEATTVDFGRVVKKVELRIFDVLGKLLNEYALKDIDKFMLEREGKVNGVYFMEIEVEEQEKVIFKLIIQ